MDYGLIAEEVSEVYPDLVVKGADGRVETVQYQKLVPMLLNELQKQHRQQDETIRQLNETNRSLEVQISALQKAVAMLASGKGSPAAGDQ